MRNLSGKVAFITGGSSGIGLALMRALVEEGMKVVFTYRSENHLADALTLLPGAVGKAIHPIKVDVTDRDGLKAAADEAEQVFGPVQLLINNAGVGVRGPMALATYDDWDWVLGVNLGGVVNGIVTFLPRMIAAGREGHIVNVSSFGGIAAADSLGVYTTSKFAVTGLTEGLRNDLKGGPIGVSVFLPGAVQTNIREAVKSRPQTLAATGYGASGQVVGAKVGSENPDAMTADEAAAYVLDGIKQNKLFIFCNPEYRELLGARTDALLAALPDGPVNEARLAIIRGAGGRGTIYTEGA